MKEYKTEANMNRENVWSDKRIAVAGVGGVGGYLAGMLGRVCPHLTLAARGKRKETLQEEGLALHSDYHGEIHIWPESVVTMEELPEFTDYSMKGRTYRYMQQDALYPFGYGLSYTRFELGEAKALQENIEAGGCVQLDVSIQNTGAMAGGQTVQVYVKALREGTPNPQLKGLKKVFLKPGEETRVTIFLPDTAFALYDEEGRRMLEAGEYAVFVGMQQPDGRSEALTGQKPRRIRIVCGQTAQL